MTRQENILTLNEHLEHWKRLLSEKICDQDEGEKTIDALQNAIKALEQEACEDCISREETLKALMDEWTEYDSELMDYLIEKVRKLPSVTAQPKMGQWIKNAEEWQNVDPPYICSECGRASLRQENFCCSCGADMRGDANVNDK